MELDSFLRHFLSTFKGVLQKLEVDHGGVNFPKKLVDVDYSIIPLLSDISMWIPEAISSRQHRLEQRRQQTNKV